MGVAPQLARSSRSWSSAVVIAVLDRGGIVFAESAEGQVSVPLFSGCVDRRLCCSGLFSCSGGVGVCLVVVVVVGVL